MMMGLVESRRDHEPPGAFERDPMVDSYRIFGVGMSPCSVKVRPYFRYKGIPQQWIFDTVTRFTTALVALPARRGATGPALDPVLDLAGCLCRLRA
jgi:hypothetical protein